MSTIPKPCSPSLGFFVNANAAMGTNVFLVEHVILGLAFGT